MTLAEKKDLEKIISDRALFEAFREKRVLITGSTGLIGSSLTRAFASACEAYDLGLTVIAHGRSGQRIEEVLGEYAKKACVETLCCGVPEIDVKCDFIFHTASPTASKYLLDNPVETLDAVIDGTRAMLELAKRSRAAMVYLSSMEEYGVPYTKGEVMTEDKCGVIGHLTPRSSYPVGKRTCECYCAAYSHEYGTDAKIARLAQTFGAGIPLTDTRMSMQFADAAARGCDIVLHTEGRSVSNFCYLTDTVSALLTIAAKGASGEAYNVCNDAESRTVAEIAGLIADGICEGRIRVVKDIPKDRNMGYAPDNTMRLNSEKLRSLGWRAEVGMKEGYENLISYLREKGNI